MEKDKNSPPFDIDRAFREHAAWLTAALTRRTRSSRTLVEDACSATWEQVIQQADKLDNDPGYRLRGWLLLVAQQHLWRLSRREDITGEVEDVADALAASVEGPDDFAALLDRIQVDEILTKLNDRQKAIALLYAAGFSYEQIAAALGISYTAVNKALTKIKTKGRKDA